MRRILLSTSLLSALVLGACASSGTNTSRSTGSPDKLARTEIAATNASTAYDVVQRLRPNWLNPPGMTMTGLQNSTNAQVLVYLDGIRYGGKDALRQILTTSIMSMEFLSPTKAATVISDLGSGVAASVIMVKTK